MTDSPSDLLHVIRDGKPKSQHRRTRSGWEAELATDGSDRFHPALPENTDAIIPALFNKPSNIWPILPTGTDGNNDGGCGGGSCGA